MIGCRNQVLPMLCWVLLVVAHSGRNEVLAAGQQRFFSPTDEPVPVVTTQSQVSPGSSTIKSCLSSESPTPFRVRIQKMKGKTATFTRTLLNQETISTFASGMKNVNATNIANCVLLAEAGGFVGCTFNYGTCNMFNIEPQSSGCESGGQDIFYVQDSYWAPKGRPGLFSLKLIHGLSSILAVWEPCDSVCPSTAAKFQLTWNNKIIDLDKTTFNYTLDKDVGLCTNNLSQVAADLKNATLKAFDDAGTLMKTVTSTITIRTDLAGTRYLLNSSNCLYYDPTKGAIYDKLEKFCKIMLDSTMFIEYVDGDFSTYKDDLNNFMSYNPPLDIYYHYVGLRLESGNWSWLSGLPQPVYDGDVWADDADEDECAYVEVYRDDHKLSSVNCDDKYTCYVCHDYVH